MKVLLGALGSGDSGSSVGTEEGGPDGHLVASAWKFPTSPECSEDADHVRQSGCLS